MPDPSSRSSASTDRRAPSVCIARPDGPEARAPGTAIRWSGRRDSNPRPGGCRESHPNSPPGLSPGLSWGKGWAVAVGCENSITLLTWEFTGRLATPQWALPRLGECVLRLVQRMGFAAELEDATRPRTRRYRTAGQGRGRVLTSHTQDRDLNLVLEPRTQPPAEHINQSTDQGIEEPQEHGPQPAPTGHGRLKTPFTHRVSAPHRLA